MASAPKATPAKSVVPQPQSLPPVLLLAAAWSALSLARSLSAMTAPPVDEAELATAAPLPLRGGEGFASTPLFLDGDEAAAAAAEGLAAAAGLELPLAFLPENMARATSASRSLARRISARARWSFSWASCSEEDAAVKGWATAQISPPHSHTHLVIC